MRPLVPIWGMVTVVTVAGPARDSQETIDRRAQAALAEVHSDRTERTVTELRPNVLRVPCYGTFELTFRVNARWINPYDPDDVQVDGLVTGPDGRTAAVPAFYYRGYRSADGKTRVGLWVKFSAVGEPEWRLRYTPRTSGTHRVAIRVRDGHGEFGSTPVEFTAIPSAHPGFVTVCPTNPRVFITSADRRLWWGCGANIAWVRGDSPGRPDTYEYYLDRVKDRMNASRFFLCHWAWLEWMPMLSADNAWSGYAGLTYYNQMIAGELDRILARAEAQQLRFMVVTENNCAFSDNPKDVLGGWSGNPYNRRNGGPCAKPSDMYTAPEAIAVYRKRLRYIIARWGYSPSLWALNSWNNYCLSQPGVSDWVREMRDYVHELCDDWRPIIYGTNYRYGAQTISDYAQADSRAPRDRPAVLQECYNLQEAIPAFQPALRDELWRGLADGLASIMVWPHAVVDKTDSWGLFNPVIRFAEGLPLTSPGWEAARVTVATATAPPDVPLEQVTEIKPFGDVPFWAAKATRNRFAVDLSCTGQFFEGLGNALYSATKRERSIWRNPPTFDVDMPRPGRIIAELYRYGAGYQLFTFQLDGNTVRQYRLQGKTARDLSRDEVWFEAPVPAGRHDVTVSNEGQDWINVRRYFFAFPLVSAAGLVSVAGQVNQDRAVGFVYVANRTAGQLYQELFRRESSELRDLTLRVPVRRQGAYSVRLTDPITGQEARSFTVEAAGGALVLPLPELRASAVLRWEAVRPAVRGGGAGPAPATGLP